MTLTSPAPLLPAPSAAKSHGSQAPQQFVPKYGKMLGPEANGILVLDEFTLDPAAARKDQHRFRTALASVALTLRRLVALRVVIAIVAVANLPLFLMSTGWWIYAVSLALVIGVHLAVNWLNKHEPRVKQRHELELHQHRELSANYRKVRDAVKFVIDTPSRMNEHLYLELLHAKRVALHLTSGTVALLDTSDDAAWKVRIVRELPAAA
jgi:hypothetical protein